MNKEGIEEILVFNVGGKPQRIIPGKPTQSKYRDYKPNPHMSTVVFETGTRGGRRVNTPNTKEPRGNWKGGQIDLE